VRPDRAAVANDEPVTVDGAATVPVAVAGS